VDEGNDARRAFLTELIDDAGLFPPASLPMGEAVAAHRRSRTGPNRWMLGRFICPAGRLEELLEAAAFGTAEEARWRVSVLLAGSDMGAWPKPLEADVLASAEFMKRSEGYADIELVETPVPASLVEEGTAEVLAGIVALADLVASAGLPGAIRPFVELPFGGDWQRTVPDALRALAGAREAIAADATAPEPPGAKIRCGGPTAETFPWPEQVALFIDTCRRREIPFKATAGLHHPFRHLDPATGFTQHGFLNVIGAAVLAHAHELDVEAIRRVVAEEDPSAFALDRGRFAWRDLRAEAGQISRARAEVIRSYGSCSFDEPVEDLGALGILPPGDPAT
jgi:hypothetical protein